MFPDMIFSSVEGSPITPPKEEQKHEESPASGSEKLGVQLESSPEQEQQQRSPDRIF